MHTRVLVMAFVSTSALGSILYSPAFDFEAMIKRGNELAKRQGYYPPPPGNCGRGATCQDACGVSWQQCPSDDNEIWCFNSASSHCCFDGTGNPCGTGYYCTKDRKRNTYCCPDGQDTAACAAAISLTVSIIRETATMFIPSASLSGAKPTRSAALTTAASSDSTGSAAKVAGAGIAVLAGAAGIAGLL